MEKKFDREKFSIILEKINSNYNNMTEFAKKAVFDRSYISKYIHKRLDNPPSPKILERIANASKDITTYEELMLVCGYIEHPNSAAYDFSTDNDKAIIDEAIEYAILNKLETNSIENNKNIDKILDDLEGLPKKPVLQLIKKEINKYNDIYNFDNIEQRGFDSSKSAVVFVYGTIPAGVPMECIEDIIDTEEISSDMLRGDKQYFGLRVKGDSMNPDYLDGDTLILLKQDDCESGDDCVVMVNRK